MKAGDPLFEQRDRLLLRTRQQLDDEAAGRAYGVVPVHQDAERHGRGRLFRGREVVGDILRDLAADEDRLADVGLLEAGIPDHREHAEVERAADVQLSVFGRGQDDVRIFDVALDASEPVRGHRKAADRAVAVDLQREEVFVFLHHRPHHRAGGQEPPERRGADRA